MDNILTQILVEKQKTVAMQKEVVPVATLEKDISIHGHQGRLKAALQQSSLGIIAEFKRKSPSLGWIQKEARIDEIILRYESMGVSALSILTDTPFFGGKPSDLLQARELTDLPILRKDFIIDEYQVLETSAWGADAILLIAAALPLDKLKNLARLAKELGLNTLLEVHHEAELEYIHENIDVVGINNRNLSTFHTDIQTSLNLVSQLPPEMVKISESGIQSVEMLMNLREKGFQGFLMGEALMKELIPTQKWISLNHIEV